MAQQKKTSSSWDAQERLFDPKDMAKRLEHRIKDISFQTEWDRWVYYRTFELRQPYKTIDTEQRALRALEELAGNDATRAKAIINQSMINGWQGLFQLRDEYFGPREFNNRDFI